MTNQHESIPDLMQEDTFEVVMRGYNRRQVHDYMIRTRNQIRDLEERLARAIDQAEQGRVELAEARRRMVEAPQSYDDLSPRLAQILKLGEEEAAAKREDAEAEATAVRESARAESTALRDSARAEAERVLGGAQNEAERLVASANAQAEQLMAGAHAEAESMLAAARQRTAALDEQAGRRVEYLTNTHTEVVRRLTEIGSVLGDLMRTESSAGALVPEAALPPAPQQQAIEPQPVPSQPEPVQQEDVRVIVEQDAPKESVSDDTDVHIVRLGEYHT